MVTIKNSVPKHLNIENLLKIKPALEGTEHFLFCGTLLGIVRDGEIIDGDDDLDIFVHNDDREKILANFKNLGYDCITVDQRPEYRDFAHIVQEIEGYTTYIDIYFYTKQEDCVHWRSNHPGIWFKYMHELKVPIEFVFPLQTIKYHDTEFSVPAKLEETCQWHYGDSWRTRLVKHKHYTALIIGFKPRTFTGIQAIIANFLFVNINRMLKLPWKIKQWLGIIPN